MGVRETAILEELVSLLPPSSILPKSLESNIAAVLSVTAAALAGLEGAIEAVVLDYDPRVTATFLEDFERNLGLPECSTLPENTVERRALVLEKFTRSGNLNLADLEAAAAAIGFDISISENFPYPPDSDGSPLGDAHIFDVSLDSLEVNYFRADESRSGDSLGAFGPEQLTCLLDKRKAAHLNYRLTDNT